MAKFGSRQLIAVLGLLVAAAACTGDDPATSPATTTPPGQSTSTTIPDGVTRFDDHTVHTLASEADFADLARSGVTNQSVVKFTIPDMLNSTDVYWMDSNFYRLHDEWYWFRLLNGQLVPGSTRQPVEGQSFATIDDVYDWAQGVRPTDLPLDLRFVNSRSFGRRLYSPEFYDLALHSDRALAAGSVIRFPSADSEGSDHWLLELEFSDEPTADEIALFFERLVPTLPETVGSKLQWVIRSPFQDQLAIEMAERELLYHDRIVRFSELVPQGEVSVYNEGIAAGRLLLIGEDGADLNDARSTDVLLVENVPDWLPPASALISSSPQTPLAHVNLLARNRGIPNASQAGLFDDPGIRQAARVRAPVIVRATGTDQLEVVVITHEEYDRWLDLQDKQPIAVPAIDLPNTPLVVFLDNTADEITTEADVARLRPVIGGKSAGFLALLGAENVTTPLSPLAVTIRPYAEHLELVQPALEAILADPDFERSARIRFLLLEGPGEYEEQYGDEEDAALAASFSEDHPPGTLIGDVLEAGGFMDYFRDGPMNETTLAQLTSILTEQFGDYSSTQGLRFRSSSTVEDIEGFSGAGLYDSNTGFLDAQAQPDEGDHKKTVERTIKKTWASYWSFEAFEERRQENVNHLSGAMGVLVHSRFDDALEINNGVATFTLLPEGASDVAEARINVQVGDESVANPDPIAGALPEEITARIGRNSEVRVERIRNSTLAPEAQVLDDAAVTELVKQLESVARLWRERVNDTVADANQIQTLTLDYEFKTMAEGWPALSSGEVNPERLVVKQARSLDPGLRGIPADVLSLPIPLDVLARAQLIDEITCRGDDRLEIFTDPVLVPDMGYSETPLVVPVDTDSEVCGRNVLYSTPDHFLNELLAKGNPLNLSS